MKRFLVCSLATLAMVACVNEDVVETPKSDIIRFADAHINNSTRAVEAVDPSTTKATLDAFDVWAYMTSTDGTVLVDEDVELEGTNWDYANLQYWTPNKNYFFAALAPMNSANWDLDASAAVFNGGAGLVTFDNVDGSEDLIYATASVATPDMDVLQDRGMEAVKFQFQHLLSKVKFTFNNGFLTNNATLKIENVEMTAPKSGKIDLGTGYDWVLDNVNPLSLQFGNVGELSKAAGKPNSAQSDVERLTIPADENYTYNIEFDVTLYYGTEEAYSVHKKSTVTGVALEMGKAYNFTAEINPDNLNLLPIVFEVKGVDSWVPEGGKQVDVDYFYDEASDTYTVASAEGMLDFASDLNDGTVPMDSDVVLGGDIDLNDIPGLRSAVKNNWTPIGTSENPFTGTFDGKGYTIKNLALVETEAKEGKAFIGFFGFAKDVTIKNVVFENVYVNIPCLDIDHSQGHIGAVVGSLEGTSTIEDVTVKGDITVYATQTANGASRVGVIAGGNLGNGKVTMKNVHVIANEGSSLIANNNTGALAGQLMGINHFENCTSNINVTVNKFFAGGLIGIAGNADTFINCHTTGDIAVVAGREGRHNDEYRVGGIAGGWSDGKNNTCTLIGCTYTGNISGKNSDGTVADPLDYMGYVGRGYALANCAGSKVIIDGTEFVQVGNTAPYGIYSINGCTPVSTADELVATLEAGEGVYLLNDIEYTGTIVISKDQNAVIDLGGKTLSSVDTTEKNYELIKNAGTLLVRNGTMKVEATHNNGWNRYSAVIANTVGGNLTVENAYLEHLGGTDMSYGIDNLTNGKGTYAVTTIQNATVKSTYRAVRQFLNGIEATNELYVKAGSVLEGVNKSIFFHDPSNKANTGKLVVEKGAELKGDVYLFVTAGSTEWPVEVSIADSALVGDSKVTSGNVPEGYTVKLVDGAWTVVK